MNDKQRSKLLDYFLGLSMGQVYAYVGMLLAALTFFSGGLIGDYFKIAADQIDRAFYAGCALWAVGTGMYAWRVNIESKERRENRNRARSLVSSLSLELARTLPPEGMTLQEITDDLAPHPHDAAKTKTQALGSLNRSRIREAAKDGQECFEHNGRYYSRNDQTIMG